MTKLQRGAGHREGLGCDYKGVARGDLSGAAQLCLSLAVAVTHMDT